MSNYLQVPLARPDSYKGEGLDHALREQLQKVMADQTTKDEETPSSSSPAQVPDSYNIGESVKEKADENVNVPESQQLYVRLLNEAPYIAGDGGELVTYQEIPWIDYSLVKESIIFHKKYYAHEIFSMTAAIMFSFAIKSKAALLLKTRGDQIAYPRDFLNRHVSTIQHVTKFFDFHKNPDEAYEQVLKIRKMHAEAAQGKRAIGDHQREILKLDESWKKSVVHAIKKDLTFVDETDDESIWNVVAWNAPILVSQFDVVTTQLGFWLYMWLFPKLFGIKNRVEEMRGIIHVWAIFGRLLGIEDRYNVCLVKQEADSEDLYEKLFKRVVLESLKNIDETVVTLQNNFVEGLRQRMPLITYKAVLYLGLRQNEDFTGDNLWMLMNWKDKLCVRFLQLFFLLMRHSKYFRIAVNYLIHFWVQLEILINLPGKDWKLGLPRYLKNSITLKLY